MRGFVVVLAFVSSTLADLLIDLPDGRIRGREIETANGSIYAFQGIPYARPPLGKLRFQAPEPPEPWKGVLEANQTRASCIVLIHYEGDPDVGEQSEDCLFVNVYTPARKITEKLPVLFWIYGGGFIGGTSTYDYYGPDDIVNEDVIVVTFNYRVGINGFLSTGDKAILGNAGLKDQLLALKWTKSNIGNFGGDSDKITIAGESAGGISVGFHLVNKKSAGLFRAAICQSGCSLVPKTQTDPKRIAYDLAMSLNPAISNANTTIEIRDFLQSIPVDKLTEAGVNCSDDIGTVVEAEDEDAFVTEPSVPLLESGDFTQVPLIIGTVSEESLGFLHTISDMQETAQLFDSDVTQLLPRDMVPLTGANLTEVGTIIKEVYTGKNGTFAEDLSKLLEYYSDNMFGRGTLKQVEIQSNYTPVYVYQFSFAGTKSQNLTVIEGAGKVGHSDELAYLFKISTFPLATEADHLTSKRIVKLWTNFIKTLNPTPDGSDPILDATWLPVTKTDIRYLDIDDSLRMKPNRKAKEMEMWNRVFYTYGKQPFYAF